MPEVAPENATFIPLGFARQIPGQPYKGSDPEWQEFINFSQDIARRTKVQSTFRSPPPKRRSGEIVLIPSVIPQTS